jgi:hypothetical protein
MANTNRNEKGQWASAQANTAPSIPSTNEAQSSGAYTPPTPPRDFGAGYRALGLGSGEGANQTQVQAPAGRAGHGADIPGGGTDFGSGGGVAPLGDAAAGIEEGAEVGEAAGIGADIGELLPLVAG